MLDTQLGRKDDGSLQLSLLGSLDEEADIAKVFATINEPVTINLRGIKRLNSLGVHRWIAAIGELAGRVPVTIAYCSYPVALQASYVANLFQNAKVCSTLAPFFCPACGYNGMILLEGSELEEGKPPAKSCPTCGAVMVFDELDSYLNVLSQR